MLKNILVELCHGNEKFNKPMKVAKDNWRTPNSLRDSNVSPSERQWKGEESGHVP
jgi:hypothetical protein